MAVKVFNGWACGQCGTVYNDQAKADVCRDNHNLIYIAFTSKDLNSLLHYVRTGDQQHLTESLMNTLDRYLRGN